jgi:hypothetical protein
MKKCKLCGIGFDHQIKLNTHLRKEHSLTKEEYIIKTEYNSIKPKCGCGCGELLTFHKKRGFHSFIKDHFNKVISDSNSEVGKLIKEKKTSKLIETLKNKKVNYIDTLKKLGTSEEELEIYYNKYVLFEISMLKISDILTMDKRTILKWWHTLGFIENKDNFNRICKKHQKKWTVEKRINKEIDGEKLYNIFTFLNANKNKFTLSHIKQKFQLSDSRTFLYKKLSENFGKETIDNLINLKNSSKPEMDFFYILQYYFGSKNVKPQFKLGNKFYDFIIGDKILIEYDGDYWHSKPECIERDKIKTKIALDNDYIIIRIKDSECKNIDNLIKINNVWKTIYQK